jgi:hypothetical protein
MLKRMLTLRSSASATIALRAGMEARKAQAMLSLRPRIAWPNLRCGGYGG